MNVLRGIYEGPGSHGVLRVAASMENVHAVLRGMPGEGYFLPFYGERERDGIPPPVTLSPLWRRPEDTNSPGDLPRDVERVVSRYPEARTIVVTRSEAALLSGEAPPDFEPTRNPETNVAPKLLPCDWETPEMRETEAAELVLEDIVRSHARESEKTAKPSVNLFGPPVFGPGAMTEYAEAERMLALMGITVNARVPLGCGVKDLQKLTSSWVNVLLYREIGESATLFLQDEFGMPRVTTPMVGTGGTGAALKNIGRACSIKRDVVQRAIWGELARTARLPWYSRLAAPEEFDGRRVFIFGDFTYALGLGHTLTREVGLEVSSCGTYMKHLGRDFTFHSETFAEDAFVTDDPDDVAARIEAENPDIVIGTHLEQDVADSLGIPFMGLCPPSGERRFVGQPVIGYVGSSRLADEIHDALARTEKPLSTVDIQDSSGMEWTEEAMEELSGVPTFLRGRAKRLAEDSAREEGADRVTREIFLDSRL